VFYELGKETPLVVFNKELRAILIIRIPHGSCSVEVGNLNTVPGIVGVTALPPLGAG
jgi:hypothetical protein